MIRLLFVDDHPVISSGLASRYAALDGFQVVGTANSVANARQVLAHRPVDIAVLDIQLDSLLLAPRQVTELAALCRVVLFSARGADPHTKMLVEAGASAFVDKSAPLEQLDAVLRDVHAGRTPTATRRGPATTARELLSAREYEIYRALATCQTPKEVAATLGIARSTVYCHIDNVRRKLGLQTLQEIVARSFAEGG